MNIAARIRTLRRQQGRTLEGIARKAGITKSMLSKVETGAAMPAIATLSRIADALGVKASVLMDSGKDEAVLLNPAKEWQVSKLPTTEKGYQFYPFAASRPEKAMQPYFFKARKGKVKAGGLAHTGEEWIYVLKGKMRYTVGEQEQVMGPGDSLYFDAELNHDLKAITEIVEYVAVFCQRNGVPPRRSQ